VEHYCANPEHICFESVTLQLVSLIFEVKVIMHSVSENNNVLFASIFNNKFKQKCQLVTFTTDGQVNYKPILEVLAPPHRNSLVPKEQQLLEAPLISREINADGDSASEQAIKNENKASSQSKALNRELEELASQPEHSAKKETEPMNAEEYKKFIEQHLSSVLHLELQLQKLRENEVASESLRTRLDPRTKCCTLLWRCTPTACPSPNS